MAQHQKDFRQAKKDEEEGGPVLNLCSQMQNPFEAVSLFFSSIFVTPFRAEGEIRARQLVCVCARLVSPQ